ncbi:hypothetical protein RB195_013507 [Necator americanus]|uniref:Sushi domain-containing protein n=1 Tax=Necator americanus TaxID=51031 RepID=A0ABR1DVU4_NECAM
MFDTCNLTVFDHLDPDVQSYPDPNFDPMKDCIPYDPLTTLSNGKLYMDEEKSKGFQCKARCVLPVNDFRYSPDRWRCLPSSEAFKCDIIESYCIDDTSREEAYAPVSPSVKPDVYIIVLDSVSSYMAKRLVFVIRVVLGCTGYSILLMKQIASTGANR